jgi:hypothetical protein
LFCPFSSKISNRFLVWVLLFMGFANPVSRASQSRENAPLVHGNGRSSPDNADPNKEEHTARERSAISAMRGKGG